MTKVSLAQLREEMRAVVRGERAASPLPAVSVLSALSSPGNLELLQLICRERPESVSRLSELTGRAQSNVSRSLQQLAGHALIRLVREGKEVRPVSVAARIDVDLRQGTYTTVTAP